MKSPTNNFVFGVAWIVMAASWADAGTQGSQAEKDALIGRPISLVIFPESIRLSGPRAMQQVLVTGRYSDGSERDLTHCCDLTVENSDVVKLGRGGLLQSRKDGHTV